MHKAGEHSQSRWRRMLLLCCGVSFLWLAMVLFSPSSASAADDEGNGGLLGAVSNTVGEVTTVVETTVVHVADAVETVAPAAAPVTSVAPTLVTPVTEAVTATTAHATEAVSTTTVAVIDTTTEVVHATTGVVSEVAAVLPVVPVVGGTVSDVVQAVPLDSTLQAVTDTLGALRTLTATPSVIGAGNPVPLPVAPMPSTGTVVLPADAELAAPHTLPPSILPVDDVTTTLLTSVGMSALQVTLGSQASVGVALTLLSAGVVALGSLSVPAGSPRGLWGGTGGSSGSSGSSAGSSANVLMSALVAALAALPVLIWASLRRQMLHDDALPGAPVFATDITPD